MKVVAIQGSPHRGNTYDRVERLGEALSELGDVEFEHIALAERDIKPCRGCFVCFMKGEEACPIQDDRVAIEEKLAAADAVVFATPVHSMHISTPLKTLVDRLAYTFHRPRYFGKYAVGLAVTGGVGLKEALGYVRMFAGAWGFEYVDDLKYTDPPRHTTMPRFMDSKDRVDEVARKLHSLMRSKPPQRLSVNDHLSFHAMRAVYGRLERFSPTDYAYWNGQGWLDPRSRYFTQHARVGFFKSIYPRFVAWIIGRSIDRGLAKQPAPEE